MKAQDIMIGDIVAIIGAKRINLNSQCAYLPSQLIDGKYLKHTGNGGIWTGKVEKIDNGMALVGGVWRPIDHYEIMYSSHT